jgi:hypothetical protein
MTATKIETANQNEPLMTCFRFITLPIRSNEGLSFTFQNTKESIIEKTYSSKNLP